MKFACWNVNSVRARTEHLKKWLGTVDADVVGLQETKVQDKDFPHHEFNELGYHSLINGQKSYNGVCFLVKNPSKILAKSIPQLEDEQKRIIATKYNDIFVVNAYVPNGMAVGSDKYQYKLTWLKSFFKWIKKVTENENKIIIMGDFNITPSNRDVYDPEAHKDKILCSDAERSYITSLAEIGISDMFHTINNKEDQFSWWDYRGGSFRQNKGFRIDLILTSDALKSRVKNYYIDRAPREWEKPSDHAPVIMEIKS